MNVETRWTAVYKLCEGLIGGRKKGGRAQRVCRRSVTVTAQSYECDRRVYKRTHMTDLLAGFRLDDASHILFLNQSAPSSLEGDPCGDSLILQQLHV